MKQPETAHRSPSNGLEEHETAQRSRSNGIEEPETAQRSLSNGLEELDALGPEYLHQNSFSPISCIWARVLHVITDLHQN